MRRTPLLVLSASVPVALIAAGLIWLLGDLHVGRNVFSISQRSAPTQIGGPFALTDQNGDRRTDKDYRNKFMLVFFGYTYCPDVCPTTLSTMEAALDKLGPASDEIVPIFISVDPKRDTPQKLKSYLSSFGTRFVGLTGSEADVAAAAKAYRVYYHANPASDGNYTVDHSGILYLMGPDGTFASYYTLDTSPDALAQDLKRRIQTEKATG